LPRGTPRRRGEGEVRRKGKSCLSSSSPGGSPFKHRPFLVPCRKAGKRKEKKKDEKKGIVHVPGIRPAGRGGMIRELFTLLGHFKRGKKGGGQKKKKKAAAKTTFFE